MPNAAPPAASPIDPAVRARLGVEPILVDRVLGPVHPSWLDALDPRTRSALTAIASTAGSPTDVDVWLARWALADLPVAAPPQLPLELAWLVRIGRSQIAFALGQSAPPNLGPRRAAIERCRDAKLDDELSLVRVACRALAPHLAANRLGVLQLTRAQPRPIGLVIERELLANAEVPLDQVPPWASLVAL
jgi:hypothetical protein